MSIDTKSISAKLRDRLKQEEDERIVASQYSVVSRSETIPDPVKASISGVFGQEKYKTMRDGIGEINTSNRSDRPQEQNQSMANQTVAPEQNMSFADQNMSIATEQDIEILNKRKDKNQSIPEQNMSMMQESDIVPQEKNQSTPFDSFENSYLSNKVKELSSGVGDSRKIKDEQDGGWLIHKIKTGAEETKSFLGEYLAQEAQIREDKTFGQLVKRDWVERPIFLGKMIAQGTVYSAGAIARSINEELEQYLLGRSKEEIRSNWRKYDEEHGGTVFGQKMEIESWQQFTEETQKSIDESDYSTEWEKKNLAPLLGFMGFAFDSVDMFNPLSPKKLKTSLSKEVLEGLSEETTKKGVRQMMMDANIPEVVAREAEEYVAKAKDSKLVEKEIAAATDRTMKKYEQELASSEVAIQSEPLRDMKLAEKVSTAAKDVFREFSYGETFNLDGSVYKGDAAISTLQSITLPLKEVEPENINRILAQSASIYKNNPLVKVGVFPMGDKSGVSIDINVEAQNRAVARFIATKNNQEAYYDALIGKSVYTDGDGVQRLTPDEITESIYGIRKFHQDNADVARVADSYMVDFAGENIKHESLVFEIDEAYSKKIADAYEAMEDAPNDPKVIRAYTALAEETKQQYDALVEAGYSIEPWEGKGQPYKNSKEMIDDVQNNKHLYFFRTDEGFGSGVSSDHPLLKSSGVVVNGHDLKYNDLFRGVHDLFGHSKIGNQFGAVGEENAWRVHSRMYSYEARKAMTSETRGQNSWVNYGVQMRDADGNILRKGDEGYIPPSERDYAVQKTGLLPEEFWTIKNEFGGLSEKKRLFTGRNKKVFEIEKDYKNVFTMENDQQQLLEVLAEAGNGKARKLLKKTGNNYEETDRLVEAILGEKYDAVRYNNKQLPQKGVEYHDLKEGRFYSENPDVAKVYSMQNRAGKYEAKKTTEVPDIVDQSEEEYLNEVKRQAEIEAIAEFTEEGMEGNYQQFLYSLKTKKLNNPKAKENLLSGDFDQFVREGVRLGIFEDKTEAASLFYSQEKNASQVFDDFMDRAKIESPTAVMSKKEEKNLYNTSKNENTNTVKYLEDKLSLKKNASVMEEKKVIANRRSLVRSAKEVFGMSDSELRKISNRDIRLMDDKEFDAYLKKIEQDAYMLSENKIQKERYDRVVEQMELKKTENLRKAQGYPTIANMTTEQLSEYVDLLETFEVGDVFLTEGVLKNIDKTKLKGMKTEREVTNALIEDIEKVTGRKIKEGEVAEWGRIPETWLSAYDPRLKEKNPFWDYTVGRVHELIMEGKIKEIEISDKIDDLAKKARKSRSKEMGVKEKIKNFIVPQDKRVIDYLEADPVNKKILAKEMTNEEMNYARYLGDYFSDAYDHLVEISELGSSRFVEQYFPHARRGFSETVLDDGFVEAFRELKTMQSQEQQVANIIGSDTGNILAKSKFFSNVLFRTDELTPSKNLTKVAKNYVRSFEKKRYLDKMIPEMDVYARVLTIEDTTRKGLQKDRSLLNFMNNYLNNKKGREFDFGGTVSKGGNIETALRTGNTLVSIRDLGFNFVTGAVSIVGEQVQTIQALGAAKYAKGVKRRLWDTGVKRLKHKNANKIFKETEAFIGRDVWTKMFEPDNTAGDNIMTAMFSFFGQSGVEANKIYLLGSITEEELKAGKVTAKRLAEMKLEAARWRDMGKDVKSIIGSTTVGETVMKYKGWAFPTISTTVNDIKKIAKDLPKDKKAALSSKEAKEVARLAATAGTIAIVGSYVSSQREGKSKVEEKLYRELNSLTGALSMSMYISLPRVGSALLDVALALEQIARWEKYKTTTKWGEKGELKGVKALQRAITPVSVKNLGEKTEDKKDTTNNTAEVDFGF